MAKLLIKHVNLLWFGLVALVALALLLNPQWLNRETLAEFLDRFGTQAFLVFAGISLSRAILLLPSTPFVLAGALAFPDWPLLVLATSMIGVFFGALLVHSFPRHWRLR